MRQNPGEPTSAPDLSAPIVLHRSLFWAGLALASGLWLLHVERHAFLCDDAFISFRYARNLAEGHGLVFNPGFERVEGYSNFLWVLMLAGCQCLGIAPEAAANPLLLGCGFVLLWLVTRFCLGELPADASPAWALVPAFLLACNRSFAVWSTSGLETRLFELLVVAGIVASVGEMRAAAAGRRRFPWSAALLAGAALTRPDGMLIALTVVAARLSLQAARCTLRWRAFAQGVAVFLLPVGGHYAFRACYYRDLVPNTYYAKVGGESWWSMGGRYLEVFAIEYFAIAWLPLISLGVFSLVRRRRAETPALIAAAVVPHAIYVAAIGGDHFEYRPLDLYLPLIFILCAVGAASLACRRGGAVLGGAWVTLCAAAGMLLPELSHQDFPKEYRTGFPALIPRDDYRDELIDSVRRRWVFTSPLPGLRWMAVRCNDLIVETIRQFVGNRQEEHAAFRATAEVQARWLSELLEVGLLPRDLHIAIDCVGVIPYRTGLRTLDRLGLTDRVVARQRVADPGFRLMAHWKLAAPEYMKSIGVDLDAADHLHLILPAGHPRLLYFAHRAKELGEDYVFARVPNNRWIVGRAVQGLPSLQAKTPSLRWERGADLVEEFTGAKSGGFRAIPRTGQFGVPYDMLYFEQGLTLAKDGAPETGLIHMQCSLATNPENPAARTNETSLREFLAAPAKR